jgi:hypothetical protein
MGRMIEDKPGSELVQNQKWVGIHGDLHLVKVHDTSFGVEPRQEHIHQVPRKTADGEKTDRNKKMCTMSAGAYPKEEAV